MSNPADRSYFFDNGIQFECSRCGNCCTGTPGRVQVSPEEVKIISNVSGRRPESFLQTGEGLLQEKSNGDCIFYESGCSIYDVRPLQCRTYPFWFKNLRSDEAWQKTCANCPGIGHGRRYSKEEILTLVNAV